MAMAISYNWLFLWAYTFYKWGFLSTYNWYNSGLNCTHFHFNTEKNFETSWRPPEAGIEPLDYGHPSILECYILQLRPELYQL